MVDNRSITSRAIYLGDGVYATLQADGGLMLTSGSHRQNEADSAMWLDAARFKRLQQFLANPRLGDEVSDD